MGRPSFSSAWDRFREINVNVESVGQKIGGKVGQNVKSGVFRNACPIRMSYVFNHTGFPINRARVPLDDKGNVQVSSGADGFWYIFRVTALIEYLKNTLGAPDIVSDRIPIVGSAYGSKKGISVVTGSGWSDATGHVSLYDGSSCSDICHFDGDPDNGSFTPTKASLWILP